MVIVGLLTAWFIGSLNNNWEKQKFTDYSDDADIYLRTATEIVDNKRFHEEDSLTVGAFRRAPGYPIFLAIVFSIFGKSILALFVVQAFLYAISIILLWRISGFFLQQYWRVIPSLLLACSWFVALHVTTIIPELYSLFLLLVLILTILEAQIYQKYQFLLIGGFSVSLFLLTKPMALYIVPILVFLMALTLKGGTLKNISLFLLIPLVFVGAWTIRSYKLFDTWQIQSGSYVVGWKSLEATKPWDRIFASFLGGLFGDVVAERYLPGYADNPEPYENVNIIFDQMIFLANEGKSEKEIEKILYTEAYNRIRAHPLQFSVAGITGLLRQNTPMNFQGQAITHAFALKKTTPWHMSLIIFIRAVWYIFLAVVVYGLILKVYEWKTSGFVITWILLYNFFYAFFTHNEARYLIPIWPFYLLFFVIGLQAIMKKYATRLRITLP